MKVIVAYIDGAEFEPIREDLLGLGIDSLSIVEASGSLPKPEVTGQYRGTSVENHLRPKVRFECVVGDDRASIVVDTLLKHEGKGVFVFVQGVEQAYPASLVDAVEPTGAAIA